MNRKKGIISVILSVALVLTTLSGFSLSSSAVETKKATTEAQSTDPQKQIQGATILHCFDWKFNDIKAELANIKKAGFTAVQTSPVQPAGWGAWYWLYQPKGFYIGNTELGTKNDLKALCTEADKYGIKVVVDVVANHLSGDHSNIDNDLKDSQYWHSYGGVTSWSDRYQVINGEIGMPDLNTGHSYVQQKVKNYISELKSVGVDGIRFDAAKHIGVPSEGDQFWRVVTSDRSLWYYGEILVGPADGGGHENIMKEYTNYITVTDSDYGKTLRDSFNSGNAPESYGNWITRGISADKLIYWSESHDTWSNNSDWGYSWGVSQNNIDRAYAVAASRQNISALYFSRPSSHNKDDIKIGQKGSTHFTSKEVAAVNHFANAMAGQKDYYVKDNGCSVITREEGAVIVKGNGSGQVTVKNGGSLTKPGTYKDEITGNTFTVTSSSISGNIGSSGIAVIYNSAPAGPSVSISYNGSDTGGTFYDTASVTLNCSEVSSATYKLGSATAVTYKDGQTLTIGSGMTANQSVTLTLTGNGTNGKTVSKNYTFIKKERPSLSGKTVVYYDNSETNWSKVNAYVYTDGGEDMNAKWPGEAMTKLDDNIWGYVVPERFSAAYVIFCDSTGGAQNTKDGSLFRAGEARIYSGGKWSTYGTPHTDPTQATTPQPTTQKPTTPQPITDPPSTTVPAQVTYEYYGDANGDGKVNVLDATIIQKTIVGNRTMTSEVQVRCDVDGNNKLRIQDATAIQCYAAGLFDRSYNAGKVYKTNVVTQPTQAPQPTTAKPTTQPTTAAPTTQPATAKPSSVVIYFTPPGDWGGNPVARCFGNDYGVHKDYTMQNSGGKFMATIDGSYTRVEFRSSDGNQWTQYYNIKAGATYSK